MRLLTLNLQHAAPNASAGDLTEADISRPAGARRVLEVLAAQIAELGPDVITLQEVDQRQPRSGRLDQTAVLAEALGWPHQRFAATYAGTVGGLRRRPLASALTGPADDVAGPLLALAGREPAGFGNAVLSRLPVTSWHVRRLGRGVPTIVRRHGAPLGHKVFTASHRLMLAATLAPASSAVGEPVGPGPDPHGTRAADGRRGAPSILATWEPTSVATVHLATHGPTARRQLPDAWWALASLPGAHVLAGDLNMRPDALAATGLARAVGAGATFPATGPDHRIDHVLTDPWPSGPDGAPRPAPTAPGPGAPGAATGPLLRATAWGVVTFVVSDHAGTWVDLEPVGPLGEAPA